MSAVPNEIPREKPGREPLLREPGASRLTRVEIAVLIAAVLVGRLLAIRACPIYDDAFITYRYARNLAEGAGMVFNPGAAWEPVLGTTTPAYGLLLAGLARAGFDLVTASLGVNILCDLVSALLIAGALEFRRVASTVAILAFAALPQVARISVGGMEAPLFACLALSASAALARKRPGLAGTLAAIDCTVRPEGLLLVIVLFAVQWKRRRDLVNFCAPVVAIGMLSVALLNRAYGFPIPQSVLAKTHMRADAWDRITTILSQSFAPHVAFLLVLPFVFYGLVRALRSNVRVRAFCGFGLAITASYLIARPHTWGWYFYVPLIAWVIGLGLGIESAMPWIAARLRKPLLALAREHGALALAAASIAAVAAVSVLLPTPVRTNVYGPMQAWAREVSEKEPEARILASDIGAIGYAWRGVVLDSEGLTWPPALDYPHPNAIIDAYKPEYLLLVAERPRVEPFYGRADLMAQYEPVARFSPSGDSQRVPRLDDLPPRWAQDYLVFKRRDL